MSLNIENQLKNSRIHESEADFIGIKYLQKAGYNPHAMSDFFARLEKETQLYGQHIPEILLTHPVTQSRLAKAKDRANQLEQESTPLFYKSLRLIQLRLLSQKGLEKNQYQKAKLTAEERCYFKNSIGKQDINCLNNAIQKFPKERLYKILKAKTLIQKNPAQSYKEYKYLTELYPSDFSIPYLFAVAYEQNNQTQKAIELLKSVTPHFFYQSKLYSKLAQLYASKQDMSHSYYYEALASFNIGNIKKSKHLIRQAKDLEKNKKSLFFIRLKNFENDILKINGHKKHI